MQLPTSEVGMIGGPASHRFGEHTGEVRLEVSAPTCEELFAEAGRGLAELMLGEVPRASAASETRPVEVHGRDRAALLVDWLNELIFLSETSKQVFTRFEVERITETEARARVAGVAAEALKTPVKAATLHGVSVSRGKGGWQASVVLDV